MCSNLFPQEFRWGKCLKMLPQWNTWTSFTSKRKESSMRDLPHLHMLGDRKVHWVRASGNHTLIIPRSLRRIGVIPIGMEKVPYFCYPTKVCSPLTTTCPIPLDPTRILTTRVLPPPWQRITTREDDATTLPRILAWPAMSSLNSILPTVYDVSP